MLFYVRDRKSIVPRKPVDIAKKENMKTNLNVNRESSTSNHVLKEYPNGTVENKAEKGALVLQKHSVILAENLIQSKRHGSELSSEAQAQKDSPDGLSVAKSELGCLSSLDHSGKDYSLPHNLKSLAAPVGKNNLRNENVFSKEGIKDSPSIVPSSTNPQNVELTTEWKSQSLKVNNSDTFNILFVLNW